MILWEDQMQLGIRRPKHNDVKFMTVIKKSFFVHFKSALADNE